MDETALAQQLHDLATQIAVERAGGNAASVQALFAQFQTTAQAYQSIGGTDQSILNLVNSVSASVQSFLQAVASAPGTAVGDVLSGFFSGLGAWTPLLIGGVVLWFAWPFLAAKRRRVNG